MINIISYEDLLSSIPVEFALTDAEKDQLREKYDAEVEQLHKWTPRDLPEDSEQVEVCFGKFEEAGTQLTAFGWVKDRRIPWSSAGWNWFGQNTSQDVYAFGLAFDKKSHDFSRNH